MVEAPRGRCPPRSAGNARHWRRSARLPIFGLARAPVGSLALGRNITIADDGVVVGRVTVPLADSTIELIAHELEHILERAEGVEDLSA